MRYLTLRHTPVTSLIGTLSLAASLFLAVVAAPAGATPPAQLSSQEKVNFEIAIKSDEELTTTITITSPASKRRSHRPLPHPTLLSPTTTGLRPARPRSRHPYPGTTT